MDLLPVRTTACFAISMQKQAALFNINFSKAQLFTLKISGHSLLIPQQQPLSHPPEVLMYNAGIL